MSILPLDIAANENLNHVYNRCKTDEVELTDLFFLSRGGEMKMIHMADIFSPLLKVDNGKITVVQDYGLLKSQFELLNTQLNKESEVLKLDILAIKNQVVHFMDIMKANIVSLVADVNQLRTTIDNVRLNYDNKDAEYSRIKDECFKLITQNEEKIAALDFHYSLCISDLETEMVQRPCYTKTSVFNPYLSGSEFSGDGEYTRQMGLQQIIGSQLFISLELGWINHTGSGELQLKGMPALPASLNTRHSCELYLNNELIRDVKAIICPDTQTMHLCRISDVNVFNIHLFESGTLRINMNCFIGEK